MEATAVPRRGVRLLAVPDRTPGLRTLSAAVVILAGFLAGRRGYEALVSGLTANGHGAGFSGVVASALYALFAAGLTVVALRLAGIPAQLGEQLPTNRGVGQVAVGLSLGAGIVAATLAIELLAGRATVSGPLGRPGLTGLGAGLLTLGGIAFAEEVVFRFALLRVAAELTSRPAGVTLSSLAYAAVHAGSGRLWPVYLGTLFCFGIVACQLTAIGHSLWLPIGAHWAWDFASFAAFNSLPLTLLGASWVAGQPYRLSAGLVMLIVMALTVAALGVVRRR